MRLRLYRSLQTVCHDSSPSVLTLGNFDGIHRGHAWLIKQAVHCARANKLRSVMLTFDPMPLEFFSPNQPPPRLMRFNEKWLYLQQFDLNVLCIPPFDQALAQMSALDFIENILVKILNVKYIFVGNDFHFGARREGNVTLLRNQGEKFGYSVITHTESYHGQAISSTRVRQALATGDFALAERLLGYPYKNIGRVVHGAQLGRQLGCPTANIPMHRRASPVHGVYVVQVGVEGAQHYGVASVGSRPAVGGDPAFLLEVHLFDFWGDLYGKRLEVTYLHKLRDEWMFDSLESLKVQIEKDCQMARKYIQKVCEQRSAVRQCDKKVMSLVSSLAPIHQQECSNE